MVDFRAYRVERKGNTLIITPQGDAAGFSSNHFGQEFDAIHSRLHEPGVAHLIVDLGKTGYCGSVIIGSFAKLGVLTKETGGRAGLCQVANGTMEVLRVMQVDSIFEVFPTRRAAEKSLVTDPLLPRLRAKAKWFVALLLIAAACVGLVQTVRYRFVEQPLIYETFVGTNKITAGNFSVEIRPISGSIDSRHRRGSKRYEITSSGTSIVLDRGKLRVNDTPYGTVKSRDSVVVDEGSVFVNGDPRLSDDENRWAPK